MLSRSSQAETLPQALGSWAARQTVLPLPPRPIGFPAPATKVDCYIVRACAVP
jgi:hypothetical protein